MADGSIYLAFTLAAAVWAAVDARNLRNEGIEGSNHWLVIFIGVILLMPICLPVYIANRSSNLRCADEVFDHDQETSNA